MINGLSCFWTKSTISYEEVTELVQGIWGVMGHQELSVTYYKAAPPKTEGILWKGQKAKFKSGMIINAMNTGNA